VCDSARSQATERPAHRIERVAGSHVSLHQAVFRSSPGVRAWICRTFSVDLWKLSGVGVGGCDERLERLALVAGASDQAFEVFRCVDVRGSLAPVYQLSEQFHKGDLSMVLK